MSKWTDVLFKIQEEEPGPASKGSPEVQGSSVPPPFPTLKFGTNSTAGAHKSSQPEQVSAPAATQVENSVEVKIDDPLLEGVVKLVRDKINGLAGASYRQFNSVRSRMQEALSGGQQLDLRLVCAAIDVTGKELVSEIAVMERGLQAAELEVGNDIDSQESEATSELEAAINSLDEKISSRESQIQVLEEQLKGLRADQDLDRRDFSKKQSQLREQKTKFTASRQRLKAARLRVAQELSAEKRTFSSL